MSHLRETISEEKEQFITFNVSQLKTRLHNKSLLFELFKPYGITNALLIDLMKVISGKTGGQIITDTHRIIKNRKEIIVSDEEFRKETSYTIENIQAFPDFPGISSARNITVSENFEIQSDPHIACIDSQKVSYPVIIRKWKAGDYFYPLGMKLNIVFRCILTNQLLILIRFPGSQAKIAVSDTNFIAQLVEQIGHYH